MLLHWIQDGNMSSIDSPCMAMCSEGNAESSFSQLFQTALNPNEFLKTFWNMKESKPLHCHCKPALSDSQCGWRWLFWLVARQQQQHIRIQVSTDQLSAFCYVFFFVFCFYSLLFCFLLTHQGRNGGDVVLVAGTEGTNKSQRWKGSASVFREIIKKKGAFL